ncbi:hypothetical protein [Bacteroides ovatus]|uniref:hypothetical protein n=1 Tax=Bacteroides ovatus TaxID=28116 RepID=UPI0012ABFF0C|nr:hypothetical protein [Bacteroides ovatus]
MSKEILEEIKELEENLEELKQQYIEETEPCHNVKCSLYRERSTLNCSWTDLVEDCKGYSSEED